MVSPAIYPCIIGGVEIFNYYFIKELAKRSHNLWVLSSCRQDWGTENISGVKLNDRFLVNSTLSTHFHLLIELIKLKRQIDIVHVPYTSNSSLAYPLLLAKKLFGIHYTITIHGGGMYPWKPWILHSLFFEHADAIVAVSETIQKEYENRCGKEIAVIPPLIPFRKSELSRDNLRKRFEFVDGDKIILSLSSIKKIKGSDTLLYAFLKLGKKYVEDTNLKLVYVGNGPMKNMLAEKARAKGFERYVNFLGAIRHEEIPCIYKLADIFVISSLFEGAPIALFEAMFNCLPIIGTDTVGINNVIKHRKNGLLFEKGSIEDLSEKIRELVENKDWSHKLAIAARNDYVRNYDSEHAISEYLKIFEALCQEENSPEFA